VLVSVTAMNIGTTGLFWSYLPEYISTFFEKIRNLERDADIEIRRNPDSCPSLLEAILCFESYAMPELLHT
jgi:hypothetical protein